MSTAAQTLPQAEPVAPPSGLVANARALVQRVELRDWVTLGLLAWMLGAMAWSVQLSNWGDLPSILPTAFLGLIAGFVVTRSKFAWWIKVIAPFAIGFVASPVAGVHTRRRRRPVQQGHRRLGADVHLGWRCPRRRH